ncbi:thioesterase II family protein [Amycolatopsis sp. GM8]|uniref:thioesterase II family protein n=1 Tax=Amycolatopsis sp. GM8 TaxID=2896530 RepID=UPI001F2AA5CB|nr:alpha/beta fold hydrolase [Amycolatopsis sp. GM8]
MNSKWLRQFGRAPAGAPTVVCFPHAGGAASFFRVLGKVLEGQVRVLAVQYPGRHDRGQEPPVADLRELAARIVPAVSGARQDGPLAFFGHSMGSIVAFETALRCLHEPDVLFASGGRAPALPRVGRAVLESDRSLLDEVLALGGTSPEVLADDDLRAMLLPVIRADYRAIQSYVYTPGDRLGCAVTAMVGDSDPRVEVGQAGRWRDYTTGRFELEVFPGDHFYLAPLVHDVASVIREELAARV